MDLWMLVIIGGTMGLSVVAAARVRSVYHRYNRGKRLVIVAAGW